MTPPITTPESLKSIDSLKDKHQKLTPQILEELKTLLQKKYGIDTNKEIFNITNEELEQLKKELDSQIDPKKTVERFLYDEYLETQIETKWIWAVSIETATSWIESSRLNDMKTEFEKAINPILDTYDFFDHNTKNIIKLALANRFLSSQMWWNIMWSMDQVTQAVENTDTEALLNIWSSSPWWNDTLQNQFQTILAPYIQGFDTLQNNINAMTPSLTQQQKQNMISHIPYFQHPEMIETWFDKNIFSQLKIENKDIPWNLSLWIPEQERLKMYILNSRKKIETIATQLQWWEQVLEMSLWIMTHPWMIGESMNSIVELLLKIPILWDMIAFFLGLNGKNPLEDLNAQKDLFRSLQSLQSFGLQYDKNGKQTARWSGIWENIDLSFIKYSEVKDELKQIHDLKGNKKTDDFWNEIFHNGFEKDGIKIKFSITAEQRKDGKINSEEFKQIVKEGFQSYEQEKQQQEIKQKQKEQKLEAQKQKEQQNEIEMTKNALTLLKWQTISGLTDTGNLWNYHDFKQISVAQIWSITTENTESTLKTALGAWWKVWIVSHTSDFETIKQTTPKVIEALKKALLFVKQFLETPEWKKIDTKKTIGNLIDTSDFKNFITSQETENNKEDQTLIEDQKTEIFIKEIQDLIWNENSWKDLNNIDTTKIFFDAEKQQMKIGETFYTITWLWNGIKIESISIDKEEVIFHGKQWIISGKATMKKTDFITGIGDLIKNGKFEYKKDETNISIQKQQV